MSSEFVDFCKDTVNQEYGKQPQRKCGAAVAEKDESAYKRMKFKGLAFSPQTGLSPERKTEAYVIDMGESQFENQF